MKKYALVIDQELCWGCKACEVACKQEHHSIDGVKRIHVSDSWLKKQPDTLDFVFQVSVCRHCEDPLCAMACPEGAIDIESPTGLVLHDNHKCNGCGADQAARVDKQGLSPCKAGCPAGIDVQGYVNLAAKGKYVEALALIKQASPFPAICGRVCRHPCETDCNRGHIDKPVANHAIERFVADLDLQSENRYQPKIKDQKEMKVAVVGSGPAGLTCAYFLAREGYQVTVFEKSDQLGGMLTSGIPAYRLPQKIVAAEIQHVVDMGIDIETGVEIGVETTIAQLRQKGFKAFFIGVGSQECLQLGLEGEDLAGVYSGLEFLKWVNQKRTIPLGQNVAVIGGGNTALDAVRSARRLGANNASILYRRGLSDMPANMEELEECRQEQIPIRTLIQPVKYIGDNGKIKALECQRVRLSHVDQSGRRTPEVIPESEFIIEVDNVITALGQETDWSCLTPECACTLSDWGFINIDPLTRQSDDPDIFAGGDAVHGPRSIIEAIADGRQAAISIDRFIRGLDLKLGREQKMNTISLPPNVKCNDHERIEIPRLDPHTRLNGFDEVQQGLTPEMVAHEAGRCLNCGSCCVQACPYNAIQYDPEGATIEKCDMCYFRIQHGLIPACADNICLAHCIHFGRPEDIEKKIKEVRQRLSKPL